MRAVPFFSALRRLSEVCGLGIIFYPRFLVEIFTGKISALQRKNLVRQVEET